MPKYSGFVSAIAPSFRLRLPRVRIPSKPSTLSSIYFVLIVIAKRKGRNKRQRGRDWSILKKVSKLFQLCYYSWWSSLFCFKGYWVYFFAKRSRQGQLFLPKVFFRYFLSTIFTLKFFFTWHSWNFQTQKKCDILKDCDESRIGFFNPYWSCETHLEGKFCFRVPAHATKLFCLQQSRLEMGLLLLNGPFPAVWPDFVTFWHFGEI